MINIRQAVAQDFPAVRALFWGHLQLANEGVHQMFQVSFDIAAILEQDMADIKKFMPPTGRLFLAFADTEVGGCACARAIGTDIAELKRIYVYPNQRKKGLGRKLLETLIVDLREAGFTLLRLESAPFQQEAHALYRSVGFRDIAPYTENEIPEAFHPNWKFMELPL